MTPDTSEVCRFVEALHADGGDDLVSFEEGTMTFDWGWRVVLQPRRWVETRDVQYLLIGHGPTYVTRTGRIFLSGSGRPAEFYEEGLAWELSGRRGLGSRLRMWWKGWRLNELQELSPSQVLADLPAGTWAYDFFKRWTEA